LFYFVEQKLLKIPDDFIQDFVIRQLFQTLVICLADKLADLVFYFVVFRHFPFQKAQGQAGLGFKTLGRQMIQILQLVFRALESVDLHEPFLGQLGEAIVDTAQADTHFFCHFALGELGVLAENFQQTIAYLYFKIIVQGMNI
jgi:hypothetical protein